MLQFFKNHSTKIAGVIVLLGLAFRYLDWPGAKILLIAGVAISVIGYFIPIKNQPEKTADDDILDDTL